MHSIFSCALYLMKAIGKPEARYTAVKAEKSVGMCFFYLRDIFMQNKYIFLELFFYQIKLFAGSGLPRLNENGGLSETSFSKRPAYLHRLSTTSA